MKKEYFDKLETRPAKARERALMAELPKLIAHAKRRAPGFARIFESVDPRKINSRKALATLPVTRKSDLGTLQKELPPLGGLNATPVEKLAKIFISPGPIYDPEGRGKDWWRTSRGLFAGGFRAGDRVLNTFAYHFTPAGSMLEAGANALGCTVIPAGTGHTEMQVAAIRGLGINAYVGTPSFLKLIVEKADELKADISSLQKAHVGAEYLPPLLRHNLRERGISVSQTYASADLGLIAYESVMPDGTVNEGMILDERLILEIVRPGTGDPGAAGRSGRGGHHLLQQGLPADPLRDWRPLRGASRHEPLRPHQRAHQGLDGTRRPEHQGARHVRHAAADRGHPAAPSRNRARSPGGRRRGRQRPHDAEM